MIVVVGDSADQITVTSVIEIFAGDDEAAEAFANGLRLELDTKDGVLVPKLSEGPRHRISRIKTHWHIQVPQHLAIEIENRFGSIAVAGVDAPVELRGFGVMEAENIAGPVTVYNSLGTVKVIGVLGDTFVKSTVGTVELANIIGDVELVSSTVDSSIRDVSGRVTVEGILGSILVERVDGAVSVRAGTGSVNIRDARSRIDVQAEIANVVVLPGAPAPIDVTVAQGAVRFNIPSELLAEYRFDLDADEIIGLERIQSSGAQQGGVTDAHLVKATVRRGEIAVLATNENQHTSRLKARARASYTIRQAYSDVRVHAVWLSELSVGRSVAVCSSAGLSDSRLTLAKTVTICCAIVPPNILGVPYWLRSYPYYLIWVIPA